MDIRSGKAFAIRWHIGVHSVCMLRVVDLLVLKPDPDPNREAMINELCLAKWSTY